MNIDRIKKKIPEYFHVLLFCRMNAMTATGIRERIHGIPDCCGVAGIGVSPGSPIPGRDVAFSVGVVTGASVLSGVTVDGIIVAPDVPAGVGRLN